MFGKYFLVFYSLILIPGVCHASYDWCDKKQEAIQRQLDYAHRYGNVHRINGLRYALSRVESKCQYGYRNFAPNDRVFSKEMKVEEKKADLEKAIAKGNYKEIIKKRSKLRQAELELKYYKELSGHSSTIIGD